MLEPMNLQRKLDLLTEAPLTPERIAQVDRLIAKLERIKTLDFGPDGDAGKSNFTRYINDAHSRVDNAMGYGKSSEMLANIEKNLEQRRQANQNRKESEKKNRSIVAQFAEQYPRFINVRKDDFEFVQPNGQLLSFTYSMTREGFVSLIYAFRKLYRSGAYNTAQKNVEEIRDFGFNISSKILSTQFSSFRTRYAMVSDVVLSYEGPYVQQEGNAFNIVETFIPGSCLLTMIGGNNNRYTLVVRNVSLGHVGEIIDTIDILLRVLFGIGFISQVDCMGDDVVEYHVSGIQKVGGFITIPSSQITSVQDTAKFYFEQQRRSAV